MRIIQLAPRSLLKGQGFSQLGCIYNKAASRRFAEEADIDQSVYRVNFSHAAVGILSPSIKLASRLLKASGGLIAKKCWEWQCSKAEIYSDSPNPITISASEHGTITSSRTIMTQPIITIPSLEIGQITASPEILKRMNWMLENPSLVTGITNVFTEQQCVMSASSKEILTTTTLKQAVHRKRSEYWHPHDLMKFRLMTGEFVRDLLAGTTSPNQTIREVSWRCVSGSGKWRLITHRYTTFVDSRGIPYQLSQNVGVEAIATPTDIVLM